MLLIIGLLVMGFVQSTPSYGQVTPGLNWPPVEGFHLVSPTEGWVWATRLYWTKDDGYTWTDITPPNENFGSIVAVSFADNQHGTVIFGQTANGQFNYKLVHTLDTGKTWTTNSLSAYDPYSGVWTKTYMKREGSSAPFWA